jgi:glycosyltransferase involved in cell wall biosynthesis
VPPHLGGDPSEAPGDGSAQSRVRDGHLRDRGGALAQVAPRHHDARQHVDDRRLASARRVAVGVPAQRGNGRFGGYHAASAGKRLSLPDGLITTVWNGIPDAPGNRGKLREELHLDEETVLVTAVGNLIERKGHAYLIRALAALEAEGAGLPWHLAIAGEGVERPTLERLIAESGLGKRVTLLGHRGDVADVLAGSDVFVMPSIWEGLPLAVLEAMFARNAVIASEISGIPEALPSESVGLLVPPTDVPALTAALRRVLEDSDLRLRMGAAARVRARRSSSRWGRWRRRTSSCWNARPLERGRAFAAGSFLGSARSGYGPIQPAVLMAKLATYHGSPGKVVVARPSFPIPI